MRFYSLVLMYVLAVSISHSDITVTGADGVDVSIQDHSRIVSVGGDVTEFIYALGAEDLLVGRDDTSTYPKDVFRLPSTGYMRTLAPEGILSLNPTLILATDGSGPPTTIEQVRKSGIPMVIIGNEYSHQGVIDKITLISQCINKTKEGKSLIETLKKQQKALENALDKVTTSPRILCLMNIQRGMLMAAGTHTGAAAVFDIIQAKNAVSGFLSYKALSAEIAVAGQPEIILIPSHAAELTGGIENIASMPELSATPAAENKKIITMDSAYLLMFGPRYLHATAELAQMVYPDFEIPKEFDKK